LEKRKGGTDGSGERKRRGGKGEGAIVLNMKIIITPNCMLEG